MTAEPFIKVAECRSGFCKNDPNGTKAVGEQCLKIYMLAESYGYKRFEPTEVNDCEFDQKAGYSLRGGDPVDYMSNTTIFYRNDRLYTSQFGSTRGACINTKTGAVGLDVNVNTCLYQ